MKKNVIAITQLFVTIVLILITVVRINYSVLLYLGTSSYPEGVVFSCTIIWAMIDLVLIPAIAFAEWLVVSKIAQPLWALLDEEEKARTSQSVDE